MNPVEDIRPVEVAGSLPVPAEDTHLVGEDSLVGALPGEVAADTRLEAPGIEVVESRPVEEDSPVEKDKPAVGAGSLDGEGSSGWDSPSLNSRGGGC